MSNWYYFRTLNAVKYMIFLDYFDRSKFLFGAPFASRRFYQSVALLGGVLLWAGCATGSNTPNTESTKGSAQDSVAQESESREDTAATLPSFRPDTAAADISAMSWGHDGRLRLGYADGKWVAIDPKRREANLHNVSDDQHAVVALSAKSELALIDSKPPVIIRLRDHQTVLRLNKIKELNVGGFFHSGKGFFVGEQSGELHIWKKSEATLDRASTKDLKHVVARQASDLSVGLPPMSGKLLVTSQDSLIMGTADGNVLSWALSAPDTVDTMVRLPGPSRSFGFSQRYIVATTVDGALRVVDRSKSVFLPWSRDARGDVVAASTDLDARFAVVAKADPDKGDSLMMVGMRDFESGDYLWKKTFEPAEICGLELSQNSRQLALCVESGILLFEATNGQLIGAFRRNADSLEWEGQ